MEGQIIGFVGNYGDSLEFVEWVRCGADLSDWPEFQTYRGNDDAPDFTALMLHEDGIDLWSEHAQPEPVLDEFFAIGSGSEAATAAMHMGASAHDAIEIAMLVDLHTGGEVHAMKL